MQDRILCNPLKTWIDHLNLQAWNLKDLNHDQAVVLLEQAAALC